MASYEFDLGTASVSVSGGNFAFGGEASASYTLDGTVIDSTLAGGVIETKHGRLQAGTDGKMYDFTALSGGTFTFTDKKDSVSIASFDGSDITSGITLNVNSSTNAALKDIKTGYGADKVTVTGASDGQYTVDLGDGKDILTFNSGLATVTMGGGKDTLNVSAAGATVTLTDYNYAEGDLVSMTGAALASVDFTSGEVTIGSASKSSVFASLAENDGVYELQLNETHYVRTGVSADYVAKDVIDFASNSDADVLNLTLAGKNTDVNTVNVGATSGTVNIVVGKAAANITVDSGVDFGLGINKKGSAVSVSSILDSSDTLYLMDNAKISDITLGSTGSADPSDLIYGTTTVKSAIAAGSVAGGFKYDINGQAGVLAYGNGTDVAYAEDVTYYARATAVDAGEYGEVVLNLNGVMGDAFADSINEIKNVTSGLVAGRNNADTKIGIATEGGEKTEVYGGVAGNDSIALASDDDATDIIWYSNGDGNDTVSGFNAENDSVYFHDSAAAASILNDVTSIKGSDLVVAMDKKNKLTLTGIGKAATDETNVINFSDIAGTNFKVAVGDGKNVSYTAGVNIYKGAKTLKIDGSDDLVVYTGASNDQYGYYDKSIKAIDASEATGTVYLSGTNASGMNITGGEGVNHMWGGGDKAQTLTGGDGVNVFWFGTGDGKDTAKNAKAEDGVNFYNVENIDDVAVNASGKAFTVTIGSDVLKVDLDVTAEEALKTFTFANQAGVQYTYDTKTNKFQQK